jgi:pimeloyl-ACP methyl ester carboxylesterase
VLAPSRPGYLRTPLQSGRTPYDQADLYAAMLDALDIERAAVLAFSSGGPSAVHFAARHPDRTTALFLDSAILMPFEAPISALQRAAIQSGVVVWFSCEMARRRPQVTTRWVVDGVSIGMNQEQSEAAVAWISSDSARLQSLTEQLFSIAPVEHRKPGWTNDQANELNLAPLPFADISAPTLIALGTNDAFIPLEHATNAAANITGAELVLIEEGHHMLSLSRRYGPAAQRQLELLTRSAE